ncbi:hypothetical protein ACH5RR_041028 [Cinchona calisaya]|uniref:Uncharacterized protein n=1 Tax=Cinchona calisaya TaxID=153742 RepID=A0ABD2XUY6_9GENT
MLNKNKEKFGVAGTIKVSLYAISSKSRSLASLHLLSSFAELVQFYENCTLVVRLGVIPMLIKIAENGESEDLVGTSLVVLCLQERGFVRARKKASLLMKKMMKANLDACVDGNSIMYQW